MARPTCRLLVVGSTILTCGVIICYRLSSAGVKLVNTGRASAVDTGVDSNPNWSGRGGYGGGQLDHGGQKLNDSTSSKENATQSQGPSCSRLWKNENSGWFSARFKETLHPVWMKENMKLGDEVAKWWLGLQGNTDKDYISELEKTFSVVPSPDRFLTRNMSTCLRCAVVGNSGNLRKSGYGALIDSHDDVIRINQAKTKGFEEDVGRKETHRLMYPESFFDIPQTTNFILLNFKVLDVRWVRSALTTGEITRTYTRVRPKINVPRANILFYNPALMYHIYHDWIDRKGRYPSSGSLAVFFALQYCDEVNVFGLGANSKGFWDHYWQADDGKVNSAFLKTHVHDSVHEYEVIEKLAEENIITLHKGVR